MSQVVGQLGMWGTIVNGIQAAALEHKDIPNVPWTGAVVGFLLAYTSGMSHRCVRTMIYHIHSFNRIIAMFILYTTAPILYRMASSAYFNIALLSSDFFGLLFGIFDVP